MNYFDKYRHVFNFSEFGVNGWWMVSFPYFLFLFLSCLFLLYLTLCSDSSFFNNTNTCRLKCCLIGGTLQSVLLKWCSKRYFQKSIFHLPVFLTLFLLSWLLLSSLHLFSFPFFQTSSSLPLCSPSPFTPSIRMGMDMRYMYSTLYYYENVLWEH